jgi:hypothetical protein
MKIRHFTFPAIALLPSLLVGCGMAETTAVTAAQAEAAVEQVKEGEALKDKVQQDIDAAQQAAADARTAAEDQE